MPNSDTPRKAVPLSRSNVTQQRTQICKQMKREMQHCYDWQDGFDRYLPNFVTDKDVDEAVRILKGTGELAGTKDKAGKEQLRLTKFVSPKDEDIRGGTEMVNYEPLVQIYEHLKELELETKRKASFVFEQKCHKHNAGETGGANFKVDAYFRPIESTVPVAPGEPESNQVPVADLTVPSEYKSKEESVYAITIEDCTMTVWYFSRSHSAKSPGFDFTRTPKIFIRILLSFLFATEDELGYDPTIKRHLNPDKNNQICFIYKVPGSNGTPDRFFKTQGAIFEHRGLSVTGRATRVWKVVEAQSIDDNKASGPEMALKDVWLDEGARTEGDNLRAIFAELKGIAAGLANGKPLPVHVCPQGIDGPVAAAAAEAAKAPLRMCLEGEGEKWRDYFLEPVCDCQGITSKAAPEKSRPDDTLFDPRPTSLTPAGVSTPDPSRSTIAHPTGLSSNKDKTPPRRYHPKRQYRVVFKQVCTALHDVKQLGDVFIALEDCVMALQLMFVAGWIHRDISTGNLYARKDNNNRVRGVLSDLEYAKPFDPQATSGALDPKTGTAYFMAVEILKQTLIYDEPPSLAHVVFARTAPPTTTAPSQVSVIHNFQHDVESVFWVVLWTLLMRLRSDASREKSADFHSQLSEIFQYTGDCSPRREKLLTGKNELRHLLAAWLHPKLGEMISGLDGFREVLYWAYLSRKLKFEDLVSYSSLYGYLRLLLQLCQEVVGESGPLPDLLPSCSMPETVVAEVDSPTTGDLTARIPPRGVISGPRNKRKQHTEFRGGDDDEYIPPPPSKAARLDRSADQGIQTTSRPWNAEKFLHVLPQTASAVQVIDEVLHEGSTGVLYEDIFGSVVASRPGLSVQSRFFTPAKILELASRPFELISLVVASAKSSSSASVQSLYLRTADFTAVLDQALLKTHDVLHNARPKSVVLVFSQQWTPEEAAANLATASADLARQKGLAIYTLNSKAISEALAVTDAESKQVMENVAFLRLYAGASCTGTKLTKTARALLGEKIVGADVAKVASRLWSSIFQVPVFAAPA
ncbi:hypothetical protein FRB90_011824, partial [Tulasnella sp. 427]